MVRYSRMFVGVQRIDQNVLSVPLGTKKTNHYVFRGSYFQRAVRHRLRSVRDDNFLSEQFGMEVQTVERFVAMSVARSGHRALRCTDDAIRDEDVNRKNTIVTFPTVGTNNGVQFGLREIANRIFLLNVGRNVYFVLLHDLFHRFGAQQIFKRK